MEEYKELLKTRERLKKDDDGGGSGWIDKFTPKDKKGPLYG